MDKPTYFDADGNPCSLHNLVINDPAWASSIITGLKVQVADRDNVLKKANTFVNDVMPQIGGLVIQDYDNLNELCMRLTKLGYKSI